MRENVVKTNLIMLGALLIIQLYLITITKHILMLVMVQKQTRMFQQFIVILWAPTLQRLTLLVINNSYILIFNLDKCFEDVTPNEQVYVSACKDIV